MPAGVLAALWFLLSPDPDPGHFNKLIMKCVVRYSVWEGPTTIIINLLITNVPVAL